MKVGRTNARDLLCLGGDGQMLEEEEEEEDRSEGCGRQEVE